MEQLELDTAFTNKGIPHISFSNGRVLTAEDLRDEQLADQLGRQQIGRAIGAGVVHGFSVGPGSSSTHVIVSCGLAIDELGQAIALPVDIDLSLVVPPETAAGDGLFTVCDPVTSNTPTGTGLYLLVVRPATVDVGSTAGIPRSVQESRPSADRSTSSTACRFASSASTQHRWRPRPVTTRTMSMS